MNKLKVIPQERATDFIKYVLYFTKNNFDLNAPDKCKVIFGSEKGQFKILFMQNNIFTEFFIGDSRGVELERNVNQCIYTLFDIYSKLLIDRYFNNTLKIVGDVMYKTKDDVVKNKLILDETSFRIIISIGVNKKSLTNIKQNVNLRTMKTLPFKTNFIDKLINGGLVEEINVDGYHKHYILTTKGLEIFNNNTSDVLGYTINDLKQQQQISLKKTAPLNINDKIIKILAENKQNSLSSIKWKANRANMLVRDFKEKHIDHLIESGFVMAITRKGRVNYVLRENGITRYNEIIKTKLTGK